MEEAETYKDAIMDEISACGMFKDDVRENLGMMWTDENRNVDTNSKIDPEMVERVHRQIAFDLHRLYYGERKDLQEIPNTFGRCKIIAPANTYNQPYWRFTDLCKLMEVNASQIGPNEDHPDTAAFLLVPQEKKQRLDNDWQTAFKLFFQEHSDWNYEFRKEESI